MDNYCARTNIAHLVPYDCRHSIATDLYESDQIRIDEISRLLGHSSTSVTEGVYIHSVEAKRRKIADLIDELYQQSQEQSEKELQTSEESRI